MDLRARMWIQLAGAVVFAAIALAEMTGVKSPTFGAVWGQWVLVGACAVMLFEVWRTRRKIRKLPPEAPTAPDDSELKREAKGKEAT